MNRHDAPPTVRPWQALLHPTWLAALAILLLNDHLLKGAIAGPVTGKLSDLAGLYLAPALLATLLGVRTSRGLWRCAGAIGAVFAAINLSPTIAHMWDVSMSALLLPFHTTTDPTDLLALPMLAIGVWGTQVSMRAQRATRTRQAAYALAMVGALASAASGPPPPEPAQFQGTVTILNKTHELHRIEIYELPGNVQLDCDIVAQDPQGLLPPELFEQTNLPPYNVPLFSGEELAVDPNLWSNNWNATGGARPCRAFLVRSTTLPDIVTFWQENSVQSRSYFHNRDAPKDVPASAQTIVIEADYSQADPDEMHAWREHTCPLEEDNSWEVELEWEECFLLNDDELEEAARVPAGTRYSWSSVYEGGPLHYELPPFDMGTDITPPARCQTPGPGEGLAWENPSPGIKTIAAVEEGLDGCHTMLFEGSGSWLVCAPIEPLAALRPTSNEQAQIVISSGSNGSLSSGEELLSIEVRQRTETANFREILFFTGSSLPSFYGIDWSSEVRTGCAPIEEMCGGSSLPIDLRITSTVDNTLIEPGRSIDLGVGRRLWVVRAVYQPVSVASCGMGEQGMTTPAPTGETYVETVLTLE